MRIHGGILVAVCLAMGLASALSGEAAEGGGAPTAGDLRHHYFVLKSMDGKDLPKIDNQPFIEFGEDLAVYGQACNVFRGKGRLENGVLSVEALIQTRRFCLMPELNELDRLISDLLNQGADISLGDGVLTLRRREPPGGVENAPESRGQVLVYQIRDRVR